MASSADRLLGVDAKIIRAEEHLVTLEHQIDAYLRPGVAKFPSNINTKDRTLRVSFDLVVEPPLPLSVIVGDVVHNARSALDHLWAALTRSTKSGFPVYRDVPGWNDAKADALSRVPKGAHAFIDSLQPCSGTEDGELIGFLNTLSNRDKHKILNLAAAHAKHNRIATWSKRDPSQRFEIDLSGVTEPFKPNTYFQFIELPDAFMQGGVDVEIKGTMTVAFKEPPMDGKNTRDTLKGIIDAIKDRIVPTLRPFVN